MSMTRQSQYGAFLGPDLIRRQQEIEQSQMYGRALLEDSQKSPQGQMVSGHYVAPSWTQHLARGLKATLGRRELESIPEQLSQLQQAYQDSSRDLFQPMDKAKALGTALSSGANTGSVGPTVENGRRYGAALEGKPLMPLLRGMSPEQSHQAYLSLGPQAYMVTALRQSEPTQIQRILEAANIMPGTDEYSRILRDSVDPNFISPYQRESLRLTSRGQDISASNSLRAFDAAFRPSAPNQSTAGYFRVGGDGVEMLHHPTTGEPLMPVTADPAVRGAVAQAEAGGRVLGESQAKAVVDAPDALASTNVMLKTIEGIEKHPGLDMAVGPYLGQRAPITPDAIDFDAKLQQLQGQIFLRAYQDLKGGGAITEPEGQKAEASLANMTRAQTPKQFRAAVDELKSIIVQAERRIRAKASGGTSSSSETPAQPPNIDELLEMYR